MKKYLGVAALVLLVSSAQAGIMPEEHRAYLIERTLANFWGKAVLSDGKTVEPATPEERETVPISSAAAQHVISVGEFSGLADWCGLDWESHYLGLTAKARAQHFSEKQVAFIGFLHGTVQGNMSSGMRKETCTAEDKRKVQAMLSNSPVSQAIPE